MSFDHCTVSARDAVAAHARVDERHTETWKAGHDIGFRESGIEALVGNAIAVEDHPVTIFERERALCLRGNADNQPDRQDKRKPLRKVCCLLSETR